jgi:RNA polymerase sigma-70 factor (ECF subfamily)
MKLRTRKKEPNLSIEDLLPSLNGAGFQQEKLQDWSENTEAAFFDKETRRVIQKAVDLLPDKEKVVFLLRDVEGLSTEKVSEVLEITIPAIKSRLHRARLFLRKKLASYFEDYKARKERK